MNNRRCYSEWKTNMQSKESKLGLSVGGLIMTPYDAMKDAQKEKTIAIDSFRTIPNEH